MDYEPVRRVGPPEVRGINPAYTGMFDVAIRIAPIPTPEWAEYFLDPQVRGPLPDEPVLKGVVIVLRVPEGEGELTKVVQEIDDRIRRANEKYEREDLPRIQEGERRMQEAASSEQERLARIRREAETL
jgi:hypothetical protein